MSKTVSPVQNKNKKDLTTGSLPAHLRRLGLPMLVGIFAIVSVNVIDTYFISLLGTEELAAISFAFPITFAVLSMILGFGIGMSSVISRAAGKKDFALVQRLLFHGFAAGFLISLIISATGLLLQGPLFRLMQADPQILPYILDYTGIWFLGIALVVLPIMGNAAMRGAGDSLSPSLVMLLIAFFNLVLDPVLIFGLLGFPEMGIRGAALATVLAYGLGMIVAFFILIFQKELLRWQAMDIKEFASSARSVLRIGFPAGLANMMQPLSNAVIVALLAYFSTQAVAGYGVAIRIQAFVLIPVMALSTGLSAIIGQNWGGGHFGRVNKVLRLALSMNVAWGVFLAVTLALSADMIAAVFSSEKAVQDMTAFYLTVMPLTFIGAQSVQLWSSSFNACGYPRRAFILLSAKIFVFFLPLAFLGGWIFGLKGVVIGMGMGNILAGAITHLLNRHFFLDEEERLEEKSR